MVVVTPFLLILITVITSIVGVSVATYIIVTQDKPDVPPVVIVCSNGTHIVNGSCVLDSPPIINETVPPIVNETVPPVVVPPQPVEETINVIMVGDIYGETGKKVAQSIKDRDPEFVPILGDLGYDDNGQYLKQVYGPLGNVIGCIIGNHDEGVEQLEQYCKNDWYTIMNTVLFIGLNTDGNVNTQRDLAVALLKDSEFMENITSVHIMSHFPWKAPPNSHHMETEDSKSKAASAAIQSIINVVPSGVKVFADNGHNHGLAEGNVNGVVVHQSGGGGRGLYDCNTNTAFPYCDNVFGFLEYVIESDGDTTWAFYNENGGKIR